MNDYKMPNEKLVLYTPPKVEQEITMVQIPDPLATDIKKDIDAKIADLNEALHEAHENDVVVQLFLKKDPLMGTDSSPIITAIITQRI